MYNTKGLVNVKNLVLKNPEQRSVKEVEFLILYLKFKFPVFFEIDRRTLEYFVKRLSFALYKPGELLAIKGEVCNSMLMIIINIILCFTFPIANSKIIYENLYR